MFFFQNFVAGRGKMFQTIAFFHTSYKGFSISIAKSFKKKTIINPKRFNTFLAQNSFLANQEKCKKMQENPGKGSSITFRGSILGWKRKTQTAARGTKRGGQCHSGCNSASFALVAASIRRPDPDTHYHRPRNHPPPIMPKSAGWPPPSSYGRT